MSAFVKQELQNLIDSLRPDSNHFGEIEDGVLILPRIISSDKRKASWPKKFNAIAKLIQNNPTSQDDCWYVPATKADGYHEIKISTDGSKGSIVKF